MKRTDAAVIFTLVYLCHATQEHAEEKVSATELEPYTMLFERHKGDLRAMFDDLGEDPGYVHTG